MITFCLELFDPPHILGYKKNVTHSVSGTARGYVSEVFFTNFYQNRILIKTNEKQLVYTISLSLLLGNRKFKKTSNLSNIFSKTASNP